MNLFCANFFLLLKLVSAGEAEEEKEAREAAAAAEAARLELEKNNLVDKIESPSMSKIETDSILKVTTQIGVDENRLLEEYLKIVEEAEKVVGKFTENLNTAKSDFSAKKEKLKKIFETDSATDEFFDFHDYLTEL